MRWLAFSHTGRQKATLPDFQTHWQALLSAPYALRIRVSHGHNIRVKCRVFTRIKWLKHDGEGTSRVQLQTSCSFWTGCSVTLCHHLPRSHKVIHTFLWRFCCIRLPCRSLCVVCDSCCCPAPVSRHQVLFGLLICFPIFTAHLRCSTCSSTSCCRRQTNAATRGDLSMLEWHFFNSVVVPLFYKHSCVASPFRAFSAELL